jgi:hypothetical protein
VLDPLVDEAPLVPLGLLHELLAVLLQQLLLHLRRKDKLRETGIS